MNYYINENGTLCEVSDESLMHYGVKGMKWGRRKKTYNESAAAANVRTTRAAYKTAKKEYKKSFSKAYDKSIAGWSPIKKHREANDARWKDAANKADAMNKAHREYKAAKKLAKQESKRGKKYFETHADKMMSKKVSDISLDNRKMIEDLLFPTNKHKSDTFSERPSKGFGRGNI